MTTKPTMKVMSKPIAVLISDIHVNLQTRETAIAALDAAIRYGEENKLPVIVAGDLHDTKAVLRGECVNDLLRTLRNRGTWIDVIVGNHDKLNEKGEGHSLEFLTGVVSVVKAPVYESKLGLYLVPYFHDVAMLKDWLAEAGTGKTARMVMHQGIRGAYMGEYAVDKSSIDPSDLAGCKIVSGHYHRNQKVAIPMGSFEYIGSPYTISFAEANDGPKGFRILHDDMSTTLVPLDLRRHVIVERCHDNVMTPVPGLRPHDLLWLKVTGTTSQLDRLNKKEIGQALLGHQNFKLDRLYHQEVVTPAAANPHFTSEQVLDNLIEQMQETPEQKAYLRGLWREVLNANH